jgi:basic membrane protein A and related proteins
MNMRKLVLVSSLLIALAMIFSACQPAAPQVVEVEKQVQVTQVVEVEKEVQVTQIVEKVVEKVVEVEVPVVDDEFDFKAVLENMKIAVVLSGPVNDAGWNTNAYLAIVHLRDKYGMQIAYREDTKVEEAEQVIREFVEAGFDIVYAHGYEYADQIKAVALEYPDKKFIQTNGNNAEGIPNYYTVGFSVGEGGYFMGRTACQITNTGKIAYIVGTSFPVIDYHIVMTRTACEEMGKGDVQVLESYVGSWADPAKTKELSKALFEQDVDVLIMIADAGDSGAVEAGKEAHAAGKDIKLISWVKDKNYMAPELIIGGWEEKVYAMIDYAVQQIAIGTPGGHFALGLEEGAVGLNPFYGLVPMEVEMDVVTSLQKYMEDPANLPKLVVRKDL